MEGERGILKKCGEIFKENYGGISGEMFEWIFKRIARIFSEGIFWRVFEGIPGGVFEEIAEEIFQMILREIFLNYCEKFLEDFLIEPLEETLE